MSGPTCATCNRYMRTPGCPVCARCFRCCKKGAAGHASRPPRTRDASPLFDGEACRLCPAERAPGDAQLEHAALHLAECTAIVVCQGGVERVMPNGSDDPVAAGLPDDVARRAVAKRFAHKHRGIRIPTWIRVFRP